MVVIAISSRFLNLISFQKIADTSFKWKTHACFTLYFKFWRYILLIKSYSDAASFISCCFTTAFTSALLLSPWVQKPNFFNIVNLQCVLALCKNSRYHFLQLQNLIQNYLRKYFCHKCSVFNRFIRPNSPTPLMAKICWARQKYFVDALL